MVPSLSLSSALQRLQNTGRVDLPGKPATWSSVLRVFFVVLMGLFGLIAVGSVVFIVVAALSSSVPITPATIVGVFGVCTMLTFIEVLLGMGYRKQNRLRAVEFAPVILASHGITLRGIGPIPWHEFGPAEHRMVPAERNTGYVRRAIMALTPSGFDTVNRRLPEGRRFRISPATGPLWNRQHHWIYVPGVEGLKQREVMELINKAHWMFSRLRSG